MNEDIQNYINTIRRDFSKKALSKKDVSSNPFTQFEVWFEEAVNAQILDPYAMNIATVDKHGKPSLRVVYLRGINDNELVFYTNYNSKKGADLMSNTAIAVNFFWGELERQVRVEGIVKQASKELSDEYFAIRPKESQIGAWASNQSHDIKNRLELEEKLAYYTQKYKNTKVPRPPHWGGYLIEPTLFEFWQGRPNRLHDRIVYTKSNNEWRLKRIAP